jgi:hypothetical protein
MTLTLRDVFVIREELSALGFVVPITGGPGTPDELVRDYVITPGVGAELPRIFDRLHHLFDKRSGEVGWFVHGSFGSGKSHFMAVLGFLLEDRDVAWAKDDPVIAKLAAVHRPWLAARRPLVVRENLLSAAREGLRFDRLVFEAVNKALVAQGKAPFEFLHVEAVLDEARREGQLYGDAFWRNLEHAGIVPGRADFEAIAAGAPDDRENLARAYLAFKGRDVASAGMSPAWGEGLQRLARHVAAQGYGGIVFLVDEMLLWLSGLSGPEYKEAVNQLNVMVDHTDGPRAVPMAVFVARQRRFSEFFPDMVDEEQLQDHLDHHSSRFEITTLEDVELRHICHQRVLRRLQPDAVEVAIDQVAREQRQLLPALMQNADEHYLRDVYPFHPALIEALIDVSSLLQRDRTALRLLYELLARHADLPLGAFVPVGSAFDAIFLTSDFAAQRRREQLYAIQRIYQQRIAPCLDGMQRDMAGEGFDGARRRALEQIAKTALLAEASPRLKGAGRITVERLVRLNSFEVPGETDRGRLSTAARDLTELSRRVPALQVSGSGGGAEVSVALEGADFGEVLERARGQVDNVARRFRTFYDVLKPMLGLDGQPGFGPLDTNDGSIEIMWRNTRRRGTIALGNVREMSYERLKAREGEFRIVIDYPWDEPGHHVEEDRQRALACRRSEGSSFTICWLPRHLSDREHAILVDLAAAELIVSPEGRDKLLGALSAPDRQRVVELATDRARTLRAELERVLRTIYQDHGEALALTSDIPADVPHPGLHDDLVHFAGDLLDRRYPQHPRFLAEPRPGELRALLAWMIAAAETADKRAPFDDATERVLRDLAEPLEIADIGQRQARLRLDTRYIRDVLDRFAEPSVLWAPIDAHLAETYGFQPSVRNLFLVFLMRLLSFRAVRDGTGEAVGEVGVDNRPLTALRLERAPVLELAEWSRARELGRALFNLAEAPAHGTLSAQDVWAADLRRQGHPRRAELQRLHTLLSPLVPAGSDRMLEVRRAIDRLAPLDDPTLDSFRMLRAVLDQWPADAGDPLREVVRTTPGALDAAEKLDRTAVDHLDAAVDHTELGDEVRELLAALARDLSAGHLVAPLRAAAVREWNERANGLLRRIIDAKPRPQPQPPMPTPTPVPAGEGRAAPGTAGPGTTTGPDTTGPGTSTVQLRRRTADPRRSGALSGVVADLEAEIASHAAGAEKVDIDVTLQVTRSATP